MAENWRNESFGRDNIIKNELLTGKILKFTDMGAFYLGMFLFNSKHTKPSFSTNISMTWIFQGRWKPTTWNIGALVQKNGNFKVAYRYSSTSNILLFGFKGMACICLCIQCTFLCMDSVCNNTPMGWLLLILNLK